LKTVSGNSVAGRTYREVLAMIKAGGRPLQMSFVPGGAPPSPVSSDQKVVSATFSEPGSLGLKFVKHKQTGEMQLLTINPGTQAAQHSCLQLGMTVYAVDSTGVAGRSYQEVLSIIKGAGRPVTLAFKPARADPIRVTFSRDGPLGLKFTEEGGRVKLVGVNPGTQAEQFPQLQPNMLLHSVTGTTVTDMSYAQSLNLIKAGGRPLELGFELPKATSPATQQAPVAAGKQLVKATFSAVGPLGLRFVQKQSSTNIELLAINPGSQAERVPGLYPGLSLYGVNDRLIAGMDYQSVLQTIKAAGRPITLVFNPAGAQTPMGNEHGAAPPFRTAASDPLPAAPPAKLPVRQLQASGTIEIVFSKPGPLGVKFVSRGGRVIVLSINPGSQASTHPELQPGLVAMSVHGQALTGKPYSEAIEMIRNSPRPLKIQFVGKEDPKQQNQIFMQLMKYLETRGVGQYAGGVRDALVNSGVPCDQWLVEITDMQDDDLEDLVKGVAARSKSDLKKATGKNGGVRNMPAGADGNPITATERDRRQVHAARFYELQAQNRLRDLESGLRDLGLPQYAAQLRQHGITTSTELSSKFVDVGGSDSGACQRLMQQLGIHTAEHQTIIGNWLGLKRAEEAEIRVLPAPDTDNAHHSGVARTSASSAVSPQEPVSVTFTQQGSLGIRFINRSGCMVVKAVIPESQAAQHSHVLRPGLMLSYVADVDVSQMTYEQTLGKLKLAGRPLSLVFSQPGDVQAGGGAVSPDAKARELHRREEQEVALSPPVKTQRRRSSAEEVLKRMQEEEQAMEAVDEAAGTVVVTFAEAGSIGIKFGSTAKTDPPIIASLKAGGQAERSGKLRPTLKLIRVNDFNVVDFQVWDICLHAANPQGRNADFCGLSRVQ
jgi:hypothetical protein